VVREPAAEPEPASNSPVIPTSARPDTHREPKADAAEWALLDVAADLLAEEEESSFPSGDGDPKGKLPPPKTETPLISLEAVKRKLGPSVLKVLEEKFNGSLTQVRHPDEKDRLF